MGSDNNQTNNMSNGNPESSAGVVNNDKIMSTSMIAPSSSGLTTPPNNKSDSVNASQDDLAALGSGSGGRRSGMKGGVANSYSRRSK